MPDTLTTPPATHAAAPIEGRSIDGGLPSSGWPEIAKQDLKQRRGDETPTILASEDRLGPFGPAIINIRWSTTAASAALAAPGLLEGDLQALPWLLAIIANSAVRTAVPLDCDQSTQSRIQLLAEVAFHLLAVTATGLWGSPLVFSLVQVVVLVGFASGVTGGLLTAGTSALIISVASQNLKNWSLASVDTAARWSLVLIFAGMVAGYARGVSGEARRQKTIALNRLNRMADANALLVNLHRITQTLPASLDNAEVLESTITRLKRVISFDSACILTIEEPGGTWIVARRQAMKIDQILDYEELPQPLRQAVESGDVTLRADLESDAGFGQTSSSGIYAPLLARGSVIGALCLESAAPNDLDDRDLAVLESLIEPVSLAIDNARWFSRLRTIGASEERNRIARDLHDRTGQSMAYLGFELDRIVRRSNQGDHVDGDLNDLREDLRKVTSEIRDTLYDLRTDVTDDKNFAATIEEFAARVAERSHLEIEIECDEGVRLPILQEREVWRIAQEALINVERHADASKVSVRWCCDDDTAVVEIADDGRGFRVGKSGRQDSYGILGMRERASSIGATLEMTSSPGEGTTVRCTLAQS